MEATIFTAIDYASQINDLFDSLGVSTDYDPCSGLMAENVEGSEAVVKIFDDSANGKYYADQVINLLNSEGTVTLADEPNNVWQVIAKAEI